MAALIFASLSQLVKGSTSSSIRCQQSGPQISGVNLSKETPGQGAGPTTSTSQCQQQQQQQQPKIKSEHIISLRVGSNNISGYLKNSIGSSESCITRRAWETASVPKNVPFCVKRLHQLEGAKEGHSGPKIPGPKIPKSAPSHSCRWGSTIGAIWGQSTDPSSDQTSQNYELLRDKEIQEDCPRSAMEISVHRLGPDRAIITNMFTPDHSDEEKEKSEISEASKTHEISTPTWGSTENSSIVRINYRSQSKASCYSDSGMSTMYTSTPIKSSGDAEISHISTSQHHKNDLEYRPGLSVSQASALSITPAALYDDSLAQVLETGDEEFRRKYSTWVCQLFHLQLTKMHRRLCHHFSRKIDELSREKEQQLVNAQQKQRDKLQQLEDQVERFQKVIQTLTEENRRVGRLKDTMEKELMKSAEVSRRNFQAELDRQINNIQAECEREKLLMQQKHGDQLKIFLDKSCSQIEKVENDYRGQVEALNRRVRDLQVRNESLEEQLKLSRRINEGSGPNTFRPPLTAGSYTFRREKEHLLGIIQDLRNKLYDSEKEKLNLMATHEEEVSSLDALVRSTEKEYIQKWEASQRNFESFRQTKEHEIEKLRAEVIKHDQECQEIIDGLREKYGSKIESLTEMVEKLHLEMKAREVTEMT